MEPQILALSLVAGKNRFACAVGCCIGGGLSLAFRVEFDTWLFVAGLKRA